MQDLIAPVAWREHGVDHSGFLKIRYIWLVLGARRTSRVFSNLALSAMGFCYPLRKSSSISSELVCESRSVQPIFPTSAVCGPPQPSCTHLAPSSRILRHDVRRPVAYSIHGQIVAATVQPCPHIRESGSTQNRRRTVENDRSCIVHLLSSDAYNNVLCFHSGGLKRSARFGRRSLRHDAAVLRVFPHSGDSLA